MNDFKNNQNRSYWSFSMYPTQNEVIAENAGDTAEFDSRSVIFDDMESIKSVIERVSSNSHTMK